MEEQLFDTEVYSAEDFARARRQKTLGILLIAAVSAAFAVFNLCVYLAFRKLPYGAAYGKYLWMHGISTFLFMIFLTVYGIRFTRLKNYAKILHFLQKGEKEEVEGVFLYYTDDDQLKDGVEFDGLMVLVYDERRGEDFERRLLYDKAQKKPEFSEGDRVAFVTQGSVVIRYRILARGEH